MVDIHDPRLSEAGRRVPPPPAPTEAQALRPAAAPLVVGVVETLVDFDAMGAEWQELLANSDADCLFLTWEWLHTWWKHLGGKRRLHIVTLRRSGRLVAIAALAVRPRQPERLFPFRAIEFMGTGSVGSDYLDIIVRHGEEAPALAALAAHFRGSRLMLELCQVKLAPTTASRLATALAREGWGATQRVTDMCPYIGIGGRSWDAYLAGLSSAHRYNLRRRIKNLHQSFQVSWERVTTEDGLHHCFRDFMDLHRARWARRRHVDALQERALVEFHEEWSAIALKRGWLRLYLLRLDGTPAAAVYGFKYRDSFLFYQSGFDPGYSAHSVGMVALAMSIRAALEEGAVEYDLLHGDEAYKFLWTKQGRDLSRLNLYAPNLAGAVYRRTMRFREGVKRALRWPRQALSG